jgi:hypothetical protein
LNASSTKRLIDAPCDFMLADEKMTRQWDKIPEPFSQSAKEPSLQVKHWRISPQTMRPNPDNRKGNSVGAAAEFDPRGPGRVDARHDRRRIVLAGRSRK